MGDGIPIIISVTISTHTHTHPFNGPLSRTTRVSRYQKGRPIWILLKQETVSGSGISWAICKSAPRSRHYNHISTPPLSFLQAGCPSCHPTNSVKALKAVTCRCTGNVQVMLYKCYTSAARVTWTCNFAHSSVSSGSFLYQKLLKHRCCLTTKIRAVDARGGSFLLVL